MVLLHVLLHVLLCHCITEENINQDMMETNKSLDFVHDVRDVLKYST